MRTPELFLEDSRYNRHLKTNLCAFGARWAKSGSWERCRECCLLGVFLTACPTDRVETLKIWWRLSQIITRRDVGVAKFSYPQLNHIIYCGSAREQNSFCAVSARCWWRMQVLFCYFWTNQMHIRVDMYRPEQINKMIMELFMESSWQWIAQAPSEDEKRSRVLRQRSQKFESSQRPFEKQLNHSTVSWA